MLSPLSGIVNPRSNLDIGAQIAFLDVRKANSTFVPWLSRESIVTSWLL
jgi:hypothetical protein